MGRISNILKISGLVLAMFISQNAFAEGYCHGRILNGEDSAYIKVSHFSDGPLDSDRAYRVVDWVRNRYSCEYDDLKVVSVQCSSDLADLVNSNICRVDVAEGYFLIFQDYVGGVNVLFNRWD